ASLDLDRDEVGSDRPDFIDAIYYKEIERDAGGKPLHTFPHPAPWGCPGASNVEENSFLLTLQVDIELVSVSFARCNERRDTVLMLKPRQNGVDPVCCIFVGKIHPRLQAQIDATGNDPQADVRSLHAPVVEGNLTRLDGAEHAFAVLHVRGHAPPAGEVGISLAAR